MQIDIDLIGQNTIMQQHITGSLIIVVMASCEPNTPVTWQRHRLWFKEHRCLAVTALPSGPSTRRHFAN